VIIAGTILINSFLRSERFRQLINSKTGEFLKANCDYTPVNWQGWSVYSNQMQAEGSPQAFFSSMNVSGIRADFDIGAIFHGVWHVPLVTIRDIDLKFPSFVKKETLQAALPSSATSLHSGTVKSWGFLPTRFELNQVNVEHATLRWLSSANLEGRIEDLRFSLTPSDQKLDFEVFKGRLVQLGLPTLSIETLTASYRNGNIFLRNADIRLKEGGEIKATGDIEFHPVPYVHLQIDLKKLAISPFIPKEWKNHLTGVANGNITIKGDPLNPETQQIAGTISLADARLEAIPALDQLATFLKAFEFKSIRIHFAEATFSKKGKAIDVSQFHIESTGNFNTMGNFKINEKQALSGQCQLGVATSFFRWLPIIGTKLFPLEQNGYRWTTVQLSGTLAAPQEDLSSRLVNATAEAVSEAANGLFQDPKKIIKDAPNTIRETIQGAPNKIINTTNSVIDILSPKKP